jgi:hypothetical protein
LQQGLGGAVLVANGNVAFFGTTFKGSTADDVNESTPILRRVALISINALRIVVAHEFCNMFCF